MSAQGSGQVFENGRFRPASIVSSAGRIESIEACVTDADAPWIVPGFIDLHIHGFGGCDPLDDLAGMSTALARAGTTAFQATLFPAAPKKLGEQAAQVASIATSCTGARCLGTHLEGPFVNPLAAGALSREDLATPSVAALREILGSATNDGRGVRTMTLAPELAGSADLIAELVQSGVRVSLGHSRANAAESSAAIKAGAVGATHLFNAMTPVHHRDLGLSGVAMMERALFAEIIGDLVHVGPRAVELALRAHGAESLCLVSDALVGAGTGCDMFHSHGREHRIANGAAYYPKSEARDADQLAGSASSQLEMVRRLTDAGVVSFEEAITMAALAPARALGIETESGQLAVGLRADWLVLRRSDRRLLEVVVGGQSLSLE